MTRFAHPCRLWHLASGVMLLLFIGNAAAQTPGSASGGLTSMYADIRARAVGDILTVMVMERSRGKNTSGTKTEKKTDHGADADGAGLFKFLPISGLSVRQDQGFEGSGETDRTGQLDAQITVRVTSAEANGNLKIEGTREVDVNNEKMLMVLTGVVRPQDISSTNTIYSFQIADAQISYKGKGHVSATRKPGIISRILNFIF